MVTSYSWQLTPQVTSGALPNPGTFVPSTPLFGRDARKDQFERGIKWANVPGGRSDFVVHGGPRVYHVNSLCNMQQQVISSEAPRSAKAGYGSSGYDGTVRFRRVKIPSGVSREDRGKDQYGNERFSFTGLPGPLFPVVISLSPSSGVAGGDDPVVVTGQNFMSGAIVIFSDINDPLNRTAINIVFVNSTEITCTTRAYSNIYPDVQPLPGPTTVTVVNPDGRVGSLVNGFTWT